MVSKTRPVSSPSAAGRRHRVCAVHPVDAEDWPRGAKTPDADPAAAARQQRRRSICWSCGRFVRCFGGLGCSWGCFAFVQYDDHYKSPRPKLFRCFPAKIAKSWRAIPSIESTKGPEPITAEALRRPIRRIRVNSSGLSDASAGPMGSEPIDEHSNRHTRTHNTPDPRRRSGDRPSRRANHRRASHDRPRRRQRSAPKRPDPTKPRQLQQARVCVSWLSPRVGRFRAVGKATVPDALDSRDARLNEIYH
jgi:hypothetical protein